jgi:hypothetical protein
MPIKQKRSAATICGNLLLNEALNKIIKLFLLKVVSLMFTALYLTRFKIIITNLNLHFPALFKIKQL